MSEERVFRSTYCILDVGRSSTCEGSVNFFPDCVGVIRFWSGVFLGCSQIDYFLLYSEYNLAIDYVDSSLG